MNWGNKLIAVFLCFGASMGFLVYRCMQVQVNLVSNEYYKDELAYQQVIDGKIMAGRLSSAVTLMADSEHLIIQLPSEMKSKSIKGDILFYCPSKSANDKKSVLQTDQSGRQVLPATFLSRGKYQVKINWKSDNISYYSEQPLNVLQ
ncbi:MAG: FixH family protein [Chitinophagaceae bacterium]